MLVYFMFFGFGRPQHTGLSEYRYSFVFTSIPLWIPRSFSLDTLMLWIFALGNLLAFVPFGILVPILFKKRIKSFLQFISLFICFILLLEIVQMVTYLGSFDVTDIIINSMGASIGFISFKISKRMNTLQKFFVSMGVSIVGLTLLTFLFAMLFNNSIAPILEMIIEPYYEVMVSG